MSSRILESRFSRTANRRRSKKPSTEPLPQAEVKPPSEDDGEEGDEDQEPPQILNIRFGFIMLYGKLTVIEVSEEVWGNRRYYCAALSDDPSICIKALELNEAIISLVRHLVRSPTIRKYYFEKDPEAPKLAARMRVSSISLF